MKMAGWGPPPSEHPSSSCLAVSHLLGHLASMTAPHQTACTTLLPGRGVGPRAFPRLSISLPVSSQLLPVSFWQELPPPCQEICLCQTHLVPVRADAPGDTAWVLCLPGSPWAQHPHHLRDGTWGQGEPVLDALVQNHLRDAHVVLKCSGFDSQEPSCCQTRNSLLY